MNNFSFQNNICSFYMHFLEEKEDFNVSFYYLASGSQPNSWSFPPNQTVYPLEDSNNSCREDRSHCAASSYYDETARSFSAAAAVAAVAAAAYISSSNAIATSGYFADPKSMKCEPPQPNNTIKTTANYNIQQGSSRYILTTYCHNIPSVRRFLYMSRII